jgi:3-oxoacyl-[acyl-carrier protein] reductase
MAAQRETVMTLAGRTALITGATGTLGRAIAEEFARSGAHLVISARNTAALKELQATLAERYAGNVHAIPCNLGDARGLHKLATEACHDGLDILVNAAAELGPIGRIWEVDWAEWMHTIDVNLHAAVRLCALCVPHMPKAGARGKIINVSGGGATSPRPRFSAYAAAKAALVRFSETLAQEAAERSIDVNCIAPGVLDSRLTRAVVAAGANHVGRSEYDAAEKAVRERKDAHRAAALCAFLASDASDGITGRLVSAQWDSWESLPDHLDDLSASDVYTLRRIVPRDRGFSWDTP